MRRSARPACTTRPSRPQVRLRGVDGETQGSSEEDPGKHANRFADNRGSSGRSDCAKCARRVSGRLSGGIASSRRDVSRCRRGLPAMVREGGLPAGHRRALDVPSRARPDGCGRADNTGKIGSFGEGHNSSGVASLATRWGLAEGRLGGASGFDTFILLANPSPDPVEVTSTYLREAGAPIVRRRLPGGWHERARDSDPLITGTL